MNKDQVKGVTKEIVGKVQKTTGEVTNSKNQQIKVTSKEIAGNSKKLW